MAKKKKKPKFYLPPDDPPTVTLGEALSTITTTTAHAHNFNLPVPVRYLICPQCSNEKDITVPADAKIRCRKCEELFWDKHIPIMVDRPPPALPPGPPAPKPKLPAGKRYAKVIHEPINPRFCFIKFEDDGTEGRLWKHPNSPSLRHVQLVVEANRDEGQGGYTIVRETPHLA